MKQLALFVEAFAVAVVVVSVVIAESSCKLLLLKVRSDCFDSLDDDASGSFDSSDDDE